MTRSLTHEAKMRRHFVTSIAAEHEDVQAVLDELNSRGPIIRAEGTMPTVVLTLSGARIMKASGKPWRLHIVDNTWEIWVEPDPPPVKESDIELEDGEAAEDDHGD